MQLAGLSAERAVRLDSIGGYVDTYNKQISLHTIAKNWVVAYSVMSVGSNSSNRDVFIERLTVRRSVAALIVYDVSSPCPFLYDAFWFETSQPYQRYVPAL